MRRGHVNIEAMEARSVDAIPIGEEWQYEPKLDGLSSSFRIRLSVAFV